MNTGAIVEYIDQQKIISAVILSHQKEKGWLKLLDEDSREINFSVKKLFHIGSPCLDTSLPKATLVSRLKQVTDYRKKLSESIDIRTLWELLHEHNDEMDLSSMTLFCFNPPLTPDHESAVIRAVFNDRLYFKFNKLLFSPYTPTQVEDRKRQIRENARKERILQSGIKWLTAMNSENNPKSEINPAVLKILKNYYLLGNDSDSSSLASQMLKKAGIKTPDILFNFFVRIGVWKQDENLDLITFQIPTKFPDSILDLAEKIRKNSATVYKNVRRTDLTDIPLITIDGQSTLDYDDAISLEKMGDGYRLGIHIIDVDAYIKSGDPLDMAARYRGSSIYMPDGKLPMFPHILSEDVCSLKKNEARPGISILIEMNQFFEIMNFKIIPSIIKVHEQLTYTEANLLNGKNEMITTLYKIAILLREKRLKKGAIQITLPEVNVWLDENNKIRYTKIDRENPSRMLVSEMMIFANYLMAQHLVDHDISAVFRSQAPPKHRLFSGINTSLIINLMQRKHLNRALINTLPESHSGLGLPNYVTATSPIRRYHDLLTQRQLKALLGFGKPYSRTELEEIIQTVSLPIAQNSRVQAARKRYWLLKYLEGMKGSDFDALIVDHYRDNYNILIKEFMLETKLTIPFSRYLLKSGDLIRISIQYANARKNQIYIMPA